MSPRVTDRPEDVRGDELELRVEGRSFTGWEEVSVARALDALSGAFRLTVSDRRPYPVRPGDACEVILAGELLISGYVDVLDVEVGPERRLAVVEGRDKTADLVDCSEISEPAEHFDVRLADLAVRIASPFGVEVRSELAEDEPFQVFKVNPGETAFAALERAARRRGALLYSEGDGVLVISRPASGRAAGALVEGPRGNVERCKLRIDGRNRFRTYVVRAQGPGGDDHYGPDVALVEGRAEDPGVSRYRPLLVVGDGAMTFEDAADRASWEATVRAARAAWISVEVPGWRQAPGGPPWRVNDLVRVDVPSALVDQELLIASVHHQRDKEQGTRTTLGLTRRDAYVPSPEVDTEEEAFLELLGGEDD